jgi:dTMP kinase
MSKFITLEGVEGAGKSTAIGVICNFLKKNNVDYVLTREPGGTEIADAIRDVLLKHYSEDMCAQTELLLMFASRAQHIQRVIKPALARGQWVVSDRFTDASFAYQGGGRQIPRADIESMQHLVQADLLPDRTFLLDLPVEIGLERIASRGEKDRIEREEIDFFERVRQAYHDCVSLDPKRYRVIDASQSEQGVAEDIHKQLAALLEGM